MPNDIIRRSPELSFLELLPALSTAAGTLFKALLKRNVQNLRLVCKDLREFVDNNVRHLRVAVKPEDLERWPDGQIPSLARYISLNSLELNVNALEDDYNELMLASLVSLPFAGLELSTRQRITKLKLCCIPPQSDSDSESDSEYRPTCSIEGIIPQVVNYLPYLRELDLGLVQDMSYTPLLQQRMFDALASLPYLEDLKLADVRALDRIGTLATSSCLTRLTISGYPSEGEISAEAIERVLQLQRLTELNLHGCTIELKHDGNGVMGGRLLQLLNNLTPSIRKLDILVYVLNSDRSRSHIRTSITILDGRFDIISLRVCEICALSVFVEVLLASRGLVQPHRLTSFVVDFLSVPDNGDPVLPNMAPMRQLLLQHCHEVKVERLDLKVPKLATQAVLELFGKPEIIVIHHVFAELKLRDCKQPPFWPPETHQPPLSSHQHPVVPLATHLASRVINRLLRPYSGTLQGQEIADSMANEALGDCQESLLLMQGDLVKSSARLPNALESIIQGLAARATEAAGGGVKCLLAYQVLPALTGGVLLHCSPAAGASEAVLAAAQSTVQGLKAELLEVLPVVPMKTLVGFCKLFGACLLEGHYIQALYLELQNLWDTRGHIGGVAERELIQQLLERAEELQRMPPSQEL